MILAEKISMLRKKAGWSQEELAEQLDVTRQSVSKWEGAQSIPDIDKILQMSRLFGVTTDFLLKDELSEAEEIQSADAEGDSTLRRVKMEEAREYLELSKKAAPKRALGTFFCIISPIVLLLLGAMSEISSLGISENVAGGIGVITVLLFVTVGVTRFLSAEAKRKEYEFLEKENFETEYGVAGMVKECRKQYRTAHSRFCTIGTVLCILSAVPLFATAAFSDTAIELIGAAAICLLLLLVGIGAAIFVYSCTYQGAMDCLLEEGDYTRKRKAQKNIKGPVSVIYWLIVTAIYLYFTYGPNGNLQAKSGWFIWAIGGVLFGVVLAVVNLIQYFRRGK